MAIELKPFKEIIAMTKEKLDIAMAPIRAKRAKIAADSKMNELDAEILKLEAKVEETCIEKEINFDTLADLADEIDLKTRRKAQLAGFMAQLFPEDAK